MRRPVDAERVRRFLEELGKEADRDVRLYLTDRAGALSYPAIDPGAFPRALEEVLGS